MHFAHLMGEEMADQMLNEGRRLSSQEALEAGLISQVVSSDDQLLPAAQAVAERWADEDRPRRLISESEITASPIACWLR